MGWDFLPGLRPPLRTSSWAIIDTSFQELVSAKFSLSHAAISAPQLLDCEALLASL
jgi:hypothetical protein